MAHAEVTGPLLCENQIQQPWLQPGSEKLILQDVLVLLNRMLKFYFDAGK